MALRIGSRKQNFMTKVLRGDKQAQTASFLKRGPTLKKKALELQTLCDVSVVIVRYGPDGSLDIWPENEAQVRDVVMRYKGFEKTRKKERNLFDFLVDKKAKLLKKKTQLMKTKLHATIDTLSKHVEGLSGHKLTRFLDFLEEKSRSYQEKLTSLELAAKQVESTNNPSVSSFEWKTPLEQFHKHVVCIENRQPQENRCSVSEDGSNFFNGGSRAVTKTEGIYGNNVFGGSTNSSCFGAVEAGQNMKNFNDLRFWWDGEIVGI
ncbi:agamous-like MADS-box protein AGL81 [Mercurialis annua]|uniref:agamous-like MADS-box protein AGL81 n=1 Tax=Mercurialis annua TaxID=3986 RepID=UPI00215FCDF8|nr:agamous-like MADS-box protein AGL81 [Mercurialis annua]